MLIMCTCERQGKIIIIMIYVHIVTSNILIICINCVHVKDRYIVKICTDIDVYMYRYTCTCRYTCTFMVRVNKKLTLSFCTTHVQYSIYSTLNVC